MTETTSAADDAGNNGCGCTCGKMNCASRRLVDGVIQTHGLSNSYNRGCRCDECRAAHNRATIRRRSQANAESLKTADNWGKQWTGPELEIATRPDLSARQVAAMLGRSMSAVKNMRARCVHEPKFQTLLGASREDR